MLATQRRRPAPRRQQRQSPPPPLVQVESRVFQTGNPQPEHDPLFTPQPTHTDIWNYYTRQFEVRSDEHWHAFLEHCNVESKGQCTTWAMLDRVRDRLNEKGGEVKLTQQALAAHDALQVSAGPVLATRPALQHDDIVNFYVDAFSDARIRTFAHWTEFYQRCGVEAMGQSISIGAAMRARDSMMRSRPLNPPPPVHYRVRHLSPLAPVVQPDHVHITDSSSSRVHGGQPDLARDTTFRVAPCRFYHGPMHACTWGLQCRFMHRDFWVAGPAPGEFQLHMPDVFAGHAQVLRVFVPEHETKRRAALTSIIDSIRNQANTTLYNACIATE